MVQLKVEVYRIDMFEKLIFYIVIAIALIFSGCENKTEDKLVQPAEEIVIEIDRPSQIADGSIAEDPILITDTKDLLAIPNGSDRNYKLAADLDMAGEVWTPIDFRGSFDGNGHSISNLNVSGNSLGLELSYDGNMKVYKTRGCGMFGILENAEVKNLELRDIRFSVETSECVFAGSVAGFMKNSVLDNLTVSGTGILKTTSKCFGIGGLAGYGFGEIRNSKADMTLICIDQNKKEKDEQFLGGAYAAGRINLDGNEIKIDGYDSDHGYVHNGGLVGMYIHYDVDEKGFIDNNYVSGRIRFFEDNRDRRAYCEPYVGEMMSWNLTMNKNKSDFLRDEVFEYSTDLYPEEYEEY